ncbi:hypothetical protein B7486_30415 [cyanobacterium TDX16]|nr:hypothetical protein B7486_30415 [cyanobacterium TDX16]
MQNNEVTIQCPNDLCKAANSEGDKFCQRCGTSLIKRYLWVVGQGTELHEIGTSIAERFYLKAEQIVLDTQPGLLLDSPYVDISNEIRPYLRLVAYRLQVPQVYGLISLDRETPEKEILLLEQAPIYPDGVSTAGQLMPQMTAVWQSVSSLRQLNWLWQIAQLWQPLYSEGVASSLLVPQFLRVEGSLLRLLQLQLDDAERPTLAQLGQSWSQLAKEARPSVTGFIEQLSQELQQGEITNSEQLLACLDRGLLELGQNITNRDITPSRSFKISTCTDTGPSRQRNEDACYPASGTTLAKPPETKAIAIVCDGIGGHEGGNVASSLAIETLQHQVQQLPLDEASLDPNTLSHALEQFTRKTNECISSRNDKEHRQGRQRMGTTLVMAVGHQHEIYIAHVGDSRAYWVTRTGCHQITLDDDVAAREVRLGYAVYREALQQPSAGSLVQAIGMSASVHPTVQRFVLDEDCVFLLCSDGLSDYDLVDRCWQTEILPILDGGIDVATATKHLVELGNNLNGHDNITVALVHCQVKVQEPETPLGYSQSLDKTSNGAVSSSSSAVTLSELPTEDAIENYVPIANTQLLSPLPPPQQSRQWLLPLLLGIGLLLSAAGGLWLAYSQNWRERNPTAAGSNSTEQIAPQESPVTPNGIDTTNVPRSPERIYEAQQTATLKRQEESANSSTDSRQLTSTDFILLPRSIVKVLSNQKPLSQQQGSLTQLQVCSTPTSTSSNPSSNSDRQLLKPGDNAWIASTELDRRFKEFSGTDNPCSIFQSLPTEIGGGNRESRAQDDK